MLNLGILKFLSDSGLIPEIGGKFLWQSRSDTDGV